jgi:hypothetical protein
LFNLNEGNAHLGTVEVDQDEVAVAYFFFIQSFHTQVQKLLVKQLLESSMMEGKILCGMPVGQ